jgi:peroxiredoxin
MKQLVQLQGVAPALNAKGIRIAAISVDDVDQLTKTTAEHQLSFPLVSDPDGTMIRGYGVWDDENEIAWPAMFVVDEAGSVRWRWLADNYRIRPAASEVVPSIERALDAPFSRPE